MAKFEIGEIAVYQNLIHQASFNGEECEIIKGLGYHKETKNSDKLRYLVRDAEGEFTVKPSHLRKKKPPQETSTWEQIQIITKWNPTKTRVTK